jgi:hypothetical protein
MAALANVKYTSVIPDGKTGNYTAGQRVTFQLPPRYAYIDGKQSYLRVEIDNTSVRSDTGAAPACPYPVVFPRHVGANALFERVQFRDQVKGLVLEDIEAYNSYVGICKSYGYDTNQYDAQDLVERVGAHTNADRNRTSENPAMYYFQTQPEVVANGPADTLAGGNVAITAAACCPVYLGMWSNLGGGTDPEHQVLANMDMGGSQLDLYLERATPALSLISHGFKYLDSQGFVVENPKGLTDKITCDAILAGTDDYVAISTTEANLTYMTLDGCAFRIGMPVQVYKEDGTLMKTTTITSVDVSGTQIQVSLADEIGDTDAVPTIRIVPPTLSYNIRSIELRILETTPTDPGSVRQALLKGVNYKTTMLTKISQPSGLLNQVIDVPAVTERALSVWALPCDQDDLNITETSSRLDPQIAQQNSYIWAIKNVLIPNRAVSVSKTVNSATDNTLHLKNLEMAMRPVCQTQAVMEGDNPDATELDLPFFYPLLLAPQGSSYSLLGNEIQLRIENTSAASVPAYLYHVFVNHTRTIRVSDAENEISL